MFYEVHKNHLDYRPARFDNLFDAWGYAKSLYTCGVKSVWLTEFTRIDGHRYVLNVWAGCAIVSPYNFPMFYDYPTPDTIEEEEDAEGWDDFEYGIYDMDEEEYLRMIL